jgi:hypothetical protein
MYRMLQPALFLHSQLYSKQINISNRVVLKSVFRPQEGNPKQTLLVEPIGHHANRKGDADIPHTARAPLQR